MKNDVLTAEIEVIELSRFSAAGVQSILDKLFDGGHLTPEQYVKRLPSGTFVDKDEFLDNLAKQDNENESEDLI